MAISAVVALGALTYWLLARARRVEPLAVGGGVVVRGEQSAVTEPAATWRPPSSIRVKFGSVYDASVCPRPVYQARPPPYALHQVIGWSPPMLPPL